MKHRIVAVIVLFVAFYGRSVVAQTQTKAKADENVFCEDGPEGVRPQRTRLPSVVVTALMNTTEGKEAIEISKNEGTELDSTKLFRGTRIRLSDSADTFFLVIGTSPMSGTDNTWYWIVRQSGRKATILLWAGANCLSIKRTKTLGFSDIETQWASPAQVVTQTFGYDGKKYTLKSSKSEPTSNSE